MVPVLAELSVDNELGHTELSVVGPLLSKSYNDSLLGPIREERMEMLETEEGLRERVVRDVVLGNERCRDCSRGVGMGVGTVVGDETWGVAGTGGGGGIIVDAVEGVDGGGVGVGVGVFAFSIGIGVILLSVTVFALGVSINSLNSSSGILPLGLKQLLSKSVSSISGITADTLVGLGCKNELE